MANNTETDIALIKKDIGFIRESVKEISTGVRQNYTPIGEFNLLKARVEANEERMSNFHKNFAYFLGLVGAAVMAAIVKWILSGGLSR